MYNRIHLNDIFKVPSIRDPCILNDPLDCLGISLCIISLYISLWRVSSLRSVKSKIVPIVLLQLYKIINFLEIDLDTIRMPNDHYRGKNLQLQKETTSWSSAEPGSTTHHLGCQCLNQRIVGIHQGSFDTFYYNSFWATRNTFGSM